MLKTEAEHILRRAAEETGAEFSDKQIEAIALAITKITSRLLEEVVSTWKSRQGGKPSFYAD